MTALLENQHIAKRHKKSSSQSRTAPSRKSAGYNSEFMDQFKQKPVYVKREKPQKQEKKSGISFPVPSLATIAIIACTVIIAFAALNWENINFDIPDIYAFEPLEDDAAGERIINYASKGVPEIFPVTIPENNAPEAKSSVVVKDDEPESHHGIPVLFEWLYYTVKKGDVISKIAENFKVSVGAIIASNDIANVRRIQEGAVLRIPNVDGIPHKVKNGDSLSRISANYNIPLEVILDINDIKSDIIKPGETIFIPGARMNDIDLKKSLGDLFMYPLQSRFITSYYGMRKDPKNGTLQFHAGVDFRGKTGAPVMASLDGIVSVVSDDWLYGKFIIVSHYNGYKTLYGHLNAYSVKEGDRVTRGRKIGEVGSTGYSTGPHLHFGVFDKNGKLVNPLDLLN